MRMKKIGKVLLYIACLGMFCTTYADTDFLGGDLLTATNWSNGLPYDGANSQDCVINTNGTASMNQVNPWLTGSTATVGGGCTLTFNSKPSVKNGAMIVNDATIIGTDDIFVDGGVLTLNPGSSVSCNDDFEANSAAGRIEINGGTHNSGSGTGNNVGAQGNGTTKVGCGIDFMGGTITAGNYRFQITSISSVGGSAVLKSAGAGTTFSDATGAIDIASDWSGSWTVGSFGPGDWEALVTDSGNGFTLDGGSINSSEFASSFAVINGGTTLLTAESLDNTPIFTADPVVKADGLLGSDYALESQTLAGSAANTAGTPVSYEKVDGLDWLAVAANGDLSGIPTMSGTNEFTVRAIAGAYNSTATLQIYVEPLGNPPVFTTNVITKADGVFSEDYVLQSQTLAGSATDADGDTLTYSKVDGPDWLSIATNGALSGVCNELGTNSFTVMVEDPVGNSDTATLLINVPAPSGGTLFLGGNVVAATNWNNGLPSSSNPGTISTNGFFTALNQEHEWTDGLGAELLVNNGAVITYAADFSTSKGTWTVTNATLNCGDDFFVSGGTVYLEEGSVTTCGDDWECNDKQGHIIVNGGMHTSGLAPVGTSQIGAQRTNCRIDFRGGTVSGIDFRFKTTTTNSVGGSAILIGSGTLTDATGSIDFLSGWSGSWTLDAFGPGDWEAALTDTLNGFSLDGAAIDGTLFSERFIVSGDGKTLIMVGVAKPVTLSIGPVVGGNAGVSWEGDAGVDYLVQTNVNLSIPSGWATWMTTNGIGPISVDIPTTADENFIRVISE